MRIIKYLVLTILILLVWSSVVNFGINSGKLLSPITSDDSPSSFIEGTKERLEDEFVGNLAMVLIENGQVSQEFYHTVKEPVDQFTIFQMASISKWVTSWGIHALARDGKIDIDAPVEQYLSRWQLPESSYDNSQVTVRNLLCHSAGLVDGLGYAGYSSVDSLQTLEESLTRASDAFWSEGVARVGHEPNTKYKYSGGGYTLLQLLIEEVSGRSFNDYMKETIFEPLNMKNSSFIWSDSSDLRLSTFYVGDTLTIAPHYKYTALAAASLYTNVADLSKFMLAHMEDNEVLNPKTIDMLIQDNTPSGHRMHGLGPMIFAVNGAGDRIIGHDGNNRDAINNSARYHPNSRDGIIIFETGHPNFASSIANEWGFWKTGIPNGTVMNANKRKVLFILLSGFLVIISGSIYLFLKRRKLKV